MKFWALLLMVLSPGGVLVAQGDDSISSATFTVRLSEGYAAAFRTNGLAASLPCPACDLAERAKNQGTRFILRMYGIPAGVRASIGTQEVKITGGYGFAVFEVAAANPWELESLVVPIILAYRPSVDGGVEIHAGVSFVSASIAPEEQACWDAGHYDFGWGAPTHDLAIIRREQLVADLFPAPAEAN